MYRILIALVFAVTFLVRPAAAQQDLVWVQIEAQPTLAEAQSAIRRYADRLQDVNGFALDGGWYAIALGPYTRDDAAQVLSVLRREGAIPRDSYIAFPSAYRQQFFPVGANSLNSAPVLPQDSNTPAETATPAPQPDAQPETQTQAQADPAPTPAPQPEVQTPALPDETPAEARRSEALLTREEREQLQIALQWAGYYTAAIDGAFGAGTRRSMAAWQDANNHEPTGILTTAQRAELIAQYNAVLDGLGLHRVTDEMAGIEMMMPTARVSLDNHVAPFAHYTSADGSPVRVVLISQAGDRDTLYGLYDIMQTLDIIPEDGERERRDTSFTITGRNSQIVSYTEAALEGGAIKGFTLVWPAGDEERRTRLLGEMRGSFRTLDAVLPASAGMDESQRVDLVSGLEVRKPLLSRSGFYVDGTGTVVTAAAAVAQCGRVTLDQKIDARVVSRDAESGLAILKADTTIAPIGQAVFATVTPRLQSEVSVAGYPYEGVLPAPSLTFGTLADVRGLHGEDTLRRLTLTAQPGDAGGPVYDKAGRVIGMLLPRGDAEQKLPEDVVFALDGAKVMQALTAAGVSPRTGASDQDMPPEDIAREARAMTVLVGCWE
ncbi:peptidoglycan-binding protein [Oceanicola sp. 22II-s10i]|uniref:trypsin-like peptidase domain-containing protein n=1 Tax=Oceanicola sp. 22II-s10i TaxID=1317116 RepID=UPI000B51FE52|nr:trypsin-like peptidase domain-containing protein [Oceanicola sp. 22II-s10i]OWU85239.1 peptidoglycan-binding protein [Oceanicola sp. 22II-s10i]